MGRGDSRASAETPLPVRGLLLLVSSILSGCLGVTPPLCPTATPYPTYTLYPTYTPPPAATAQLPAADVPSPGNIPWQEAGAYIGEHHTVQGKVIATHNTGRVVFLNFSTDYRHTFKGVIFPEDWHKFSRPPEELFYGQRVHITGLIEEYEGAPEIIIREPTQIEVIADTNCPPCPIQELHPVIPSHTPGATSKAQVVAPADTPTVSPTLRIIPVEQAADYIGLEAVVEGKIVDTYRSERVVRLNFHHDWRHHFNAVIFPEAWPLFPAPPEELFQGRWVRVNGVISEYLGAPQIIVRSPEQIVIVEGE